MRYDCPAMEDCYVCGRPGADTRDHVIPESFFPTPKPNNLITLPAHYSCHDRLGEEYVRSILAGLAESKPAMQLNEGPAGRALRRNEPLKRDLRASMIRRIVHHRGNILPVNVRFNWAINEALVGGRAALFQAAASGRDFPGVLEYRYGVASDEKTVMTIWWLRFYGGATFRCVTQQES